MDYYMITTTDNPFSPVTDYDAWLTWDMAHHNTNALLARVIRTSPDLSDLDQVLAEQEAIDEIVEQNLSGVHTKVRAGSYENVFEQASADASSTEDRAA